MAVVDIPMPDRDTRRRTALVADPRLFLITWLVLNRTPFEHIVREYALAERDVVRYLIRLDRLRIIDLLPGNRVKLLVDRCARPQPPALEIDPRSSPGTPTARSPKPSPLKSAIADS